MKTLLENLIEYANNFSDMYDSTNHSLELCIQENEKNATVVIDIVAFNNDERLVLHHHTCSLMLYSFNQDKGKIIDEMCRTILERSFMQGIYGTGMIKMAQSKSNRNSNAGRNNVQSNKLIDG